MKRGRGEFSRNSRGGIVEGIGRGAPDDSGDGEEVDERRRGCSRKSGGADWGLIEQRGFDWALELLETRRDDYGLIIASFLVCFECGSCSWNIGVPLLDLDRSLLGSCENLSCELGNEREELTVWD
ncbi:hypothetical protein Droror1_Dr00019294 [Drosera rotundifolia]